MNESMGALAAALAAAQGEMRAAEKSAKNPHLNSRFADLASCWDAIREPLSRHELAIVQLVSAEPTEEDRGRVVVETHLLHAAGASMVSRLGMPYGPMKGLNPAQCMGVTLAYARRYALMGIVGIAADDADGGSPPARRAPAPPPPAAKPAAPPHHPSWSGEYKAFFARLRDAGWENHEEVCELSAWLHAQGHWSESWVGMRPSQMDTAQRGALLAWLGSEESGDVIGRWMESREVAP